jgi:hypothetical protein
VQDYTSAAWDELSESGRNAFEAAYSCCGFKNSFDRTACSAEKAESTRACSPELSGRQENILRFLIAGCILTGVITLIMYMIACGLSRQYKKAQIRFKQQQAQIRLKANIDQSQAASILQDFDSKVDVIKTSPLKAHEGRSTTNFLSGLFKPVPKPIQNINRTSRSSGSNLTYEEIAAKYRNEK